MLRRDINGKYALQETDHCRKQAEACPEEAIGYLNSALKIHCDRSPLYLQRGLAYWRNGDLDSMVRIALGLLLPFLEMCLSLKSVLQGPDALAILEALLRHTWHCVNPLWLCSGSGHVHSYCLGQFSFNCSSAFFPRTGTRQL